MLDSILKNMEGYLSRKPFDPIYWWSSQCWNAVLQIFPPLAKQPLWQRTEAELSTLRLFGVTPAQLKQEIQHYWKKPKWQRWFIGLFSAINKKIELWFYYQKCLAYREIQKLGISSNTCSNLTLPEEAVVNSLTNWLKRERLRFENTLEQQFRRTVLQEQQFAQTLQRYQRLEDKRFLKKFSRLLQQLPPSYNTTNFEKQVYRAYNHMEKTLTRYLSLWYKNVFPTTQPVASVSTAPTNTVTERSLVPLGVSGPPQSVPSAISPEPNVDPNDSSGSLSFANSAQWFTARRQAIKTCLEQAEEENIAIKVQALLERSLQDLNAFTAPQISSLRQRIRTISPTDINQHKAALEFILHLQSELLKHYKNASLLFHPDRYQGLLLALKLPELIRYWNQTFVRFKQQMEETLRQIQQSRAELEIWYPKAKQQLVAAAHFQQQLVELRAEIDHVNTRLKELGEQTKIQNEEAALLAKTENFCAEMDVQLVELQDKTAALQEKTKECKVDLEKEDKKMFAMGEQLAKMQAEMEGRAKIEEAEEEEQEAEERALLANLYAEMEEQVHAFLRKNNSRERQGEESLNEEPAHFFKRY
jgi:hypothetical protein